MNRRAVGVLGAAAAAILAGSGVSLYASRHTPPPVLISDAAPGGQPGAQAPAPPQVPKAAAQDSPGEAVPAAPQNSSNGAAPSAAPQTFPGGAKPAAPGSAGATAPQAPAGLYVHVAGAVKRPDMYVLPSGSRVYNAIKAAGGAASGADLDAVNLAEPLTDGEKVYVPRKNESAPPADAGNALGHVSSASPAPKANSGQESHGRTRGGTAHGSGGGSDKLTDPSEGTVNINTATAEQLERLPGIGPAMASRILEFRKQNGKFRTLDDLREVSGIGDKKLAKLAPFVRL